MFEFDEDEYPHEMWFEEESDSEEACADNLRTPRIKTITSLKRCKTINAKRLCILDSFYKLNTEGRYDIGGCYTHDVPDLWFYYTTTVCPAQVNLINIFVCHRRTGSFAIGISNSNGLTTPAYNDRKVAALPSILTWYRFQSWQKDQSHYVKTFSFTCDEKKLLEKSFLYIPISVIMQPTFSLSDDTLDSIKLEHNSNKISLTGNEDFTLISGDGTRFPVHKIIVAANSEILKEKMNKSGNSLNLSEKDNVVEPLIEYMYKGAIENIFSHDMCKLLQISHKYGIMSLFDVLKYQVGKNIDVDNAIDLIIIAKKHNVKELEEDVFNFIKKWPDVLDSESWKRLKDVELVKSLFQNTQIK